MIHHVFNSTLVSGPETLVLPNLQGFEQPIEIVLLQEGRRAEGATTVANYARGLGFTVHEISVRGRVDMQAMFALRKLWQKSNPRLVHTHGPKASLYAMLALKTSLVGNRPRLLTTHHGVRANDQSMKLKFFETLYEKIVMPQCDLCLTVCNSDRELLIKRGISAKKIEVHLNGVDRKDFSPTERLDAASAARSAWKNALGGIQLDGFLIGVVGRLSEEKQHVRIIEGFARLIAHQPNFKARLLCFGSGPLEAQLKEVSERLGVSDLVHWMGYRRDVAVEMTGLDVLLSLSNAEGLPINLIEAGWAGTPVVATGVDGVRDLIEPNQNGILLDTTATNEQIVEALMRVLGDKKFSTELSRSFQVRVRQKFSKQAWRDRLEEVYERFVTRTP